MFKSNGGLHPTNDWILDDTHPALRTKCKNVVLPLNQEDQEYVNKLVTYIDACAKGISKKYGLQEGIAIAAPQVGCDKRIIYTNFQYDTKIYKYLLANPKIIQHSLQKCCLTNGEGCLSVKTKHEGNVERWYHIVVEGYDMLAKKNIILELSGLPAVCFQHEIEHLDGILFYDHIKKEKTFLNNENLIMI